MLLMKEQLWSVITGTTPTPITDAWTLMFDGRKGEGVHRSTGRRQSVDPYRTEKDGERDVGSVEIVPRKINIVQQSESVAPTLPTYPNRRG